MMRSLAVTTALAAASVAHAAAQSPPPIPAVTVDVVRAVQQNPAVLLRDGTYSAEINGASYWAFNDTGLSAPNASGENFFSAGCRSTNC